MGWAGLHVCQSDEYSKVSLPLLTTNMRKGKVNLEPLCWDQLKDEQARLCVHLMNKRLGVGGLDQGKPEDHGESLRFSS